MRAVDVMRSAYLARNRTYEDPSLKGLVFHFSPITTADAKMLEERKIESDVERSVVMLIHKAKDAEGKPLFEMGEKHYLMNDVPLVVLTRICNEMWADTDALPGEPAEAIAHAEAAVRADPS